MKSIEIFDTTLRDGEQAIGKRLKHGVQSKLEIAPRLAEMGVDTIEAGFPGSSPADFEAVTKIAKQVHGPYIAGLARTNKKDITAAWEAVKHSSKPMIHTFTYMINKDALESYDITAEEIIDKSIKGVRLARKFIGKRGRVEFSAQNTIFAIEEAFVNNDQQTLIEFIAELYTRVIEEGADVINLPDTEGRVLPFQMVHAIDFIRNNVSKVENALISVHCHNDLGLATTNSIAAVMHGAGQIECTVNGIGERAGNAALEEVVMGIWTHKDTIGCKTDIKTEMLGDASRIVSYHTGWEVQPNKAIVGSNALQHSSGIHQDGNTKGEKTGKQVYQIFGTDTVGWIGESNRLTARSGKSGVHARLKQLGYDVDIKYVQKQVMPIFTNIADQCDEINDVDLRVIMDGLNRGKQRLKFISHSLKKEMNKEHYHAAVALEVDGREVSSDYIMSLSNGIESSGAIDALFTAIDSIIPCLDIPKLVVYEPKNIGKMHSTDAEVTIILSHNGFTGSVRVNEQVYIGRAKHADTLQASVKAYVNALNKYLS